MRDFQRKRFFLAIFPLVFLYLFSSCQDSTQVSGMRSVVFSTSDSKIPVCESREQVINFSNDADEELVLFGAGMSLGTDVKHNFLLKTIKIGTDERSVSNGSLGETHIPARTSYSFKIQYSPKFENQSDTAYLDIAYKSPQQGIFQVRLDGVSSTRSSTCPPTASNNSPVGFDGAQILTINKLVAATSALGSILSSDQGDVDFVPVDIPVIFSQSDHSLVLPAIPESRNLLLPKPGLRRGHEADPAILTLQIENPTRISTLAELRGIFDPSNGSVILSGVRVRMNGDFQTQLSMNLTTEKLTNNISPQVREDSLALLEDLWDSTRRELSGRRINPANGNIILIGFTRIDSITFTNPRLEPLGGNSMAVIIYANVHAAPGT